MRVSGEIIEIDYDHTRGFFERRSERFDGDNPYAVTMYQNNNRKLVESRNKKEVEKLLPMIQLDSESRVLDIACGIGRWADAIECDIDEYCGIDFSPKLIQIARERNRKDNFHFFDGDIGAITQILSDSAMDKFDRVLLMGILVYLNDRDIQDLFDEVEPNLKEHTIICIREPIAVEHRLTLKDFFSEDLEDYYNAIYRTRDELQVIFGDSLVKQGFTLVADGVLFDEQDLNNRKETIQYYFTFER